jgi:hypothetical protein
VRRVAEPAPTRQPRRVVVTRQSGRP